MKDSSVIGIDIGGTNFRIGTVYENLETAYFRKMPVGQVLGTEDAMGDLQCYLEDYCEMLRRDGINPGAVAIGFPATLDKDRKTVLQAPNVPFMEKLPIVQRMTDILKMPVFIERDVCMALYYDKEKYKIPECEILAGCYFGTGIGNAITVHGKPLLGRNGTAGELGHIPVDGSEIPCGCGNTGCIENLAGGKYLAALCREVYTDTGIEDIFVKHGEEPLLRQFVDRMAMAVVTEINILNPDYMIIGGGVPNMKKFPTDFLRERIVARCRKPYPAEDLNLIFAEDAEDKCVIGAALFARR